MFPTRIPADVAAVPVLRVRHSFRRRPDCGGSTSEGTRVDEALSRHFMGHHSPFQRHPRPEDPVGTERGSTALTARTAFRDGAVQVGATIFFNHVYRCMRMNNRLGTEEVKTRVYYRRFARHPGLKKAGPRLERG